MAPTTTKKKSNPRLAFELANPQGYNPPNMGPSGPTDIWKAGQLGAPTPGGMPMPETPGNLANRSGSGGGMGGGGGPNPASVRAAADATFKLDESPYWMMQAAINNRVAQANAYSPDFAAMEAEYRRRLQGIDASRAQAVTDRLGQIQTFGRGLNDQANASMAGGLRDLQAQGVNVDNYMRQATQMGNERNTALGNTGSYLGMLNASAANQLADYLGGAGMIRQGAEAGLANSRGALLNQLAGETANVQLQAAQGRLANDQAKREFLLRYGVV